MPLVFVSLLYGFLRCVFVAFHHSQFEAIRADMQQALARILVATAEAQPHIGYCQGMNFVAVQVLYTLAETRALSSDYPDEGEVRAFLWCFLVGWSGPTLTLNCFCLQRDDFLLQFSADEMPEVNWLSLRATCAIAEFTVFTALRVCLPACSMCQRQSLHLMPHLTMQGEEYSFWIFLSMLTNLNMKSLVRASFFFFIGFSNICGGGLRSLT